MTKRFKLYLAGIETLNRTEHSTYYRLFKLYLAGIETVTRSYGIINGKGSNCTLLELKLKRGSIMRIRVIEFKLYLAGIETSHKAHTREVNQSSNCTLLELKQVHRNRQFSSYRVQIVPCWNWNNPTEGSLLTYVSVQIVPCWNWNSTRWMQCRWLMSSNCTLLELKQECNHKAIYRTPCSNCTLLELKLHQGRI